MGMVPEGLGMMEEVDWFNRRSADSLVCSFVDLAVSAHLRSRRGEVEALGRTVDPNKMTWNAGDFAGCALCDWERCEDCASRWLLGLGRS